MAILNVKDLSWKYSLNKKRTLKRITMTLDKGQFLGIIGPNGAGKTTLAKVLVGLIPNKYNGDIHGNVRLGGLDARENGMGELAKKAGMVFSNPLAQMTGSKMTVEEEVAFGLEQLGVERGEMKKRVAEVLEWVGLSDQADRDPVEELSGGQKQKVAIASLLVMQPEVLVLDEPTTMLDPIGTKKVFNVLEKLEKRADVTTILISHKLEKVAKYADKCVVLEEGRIKERGTPKEILTKISNGRFKLEDYQMETLSITKLAQGLKANGNWKGKLPVLLEEAEKGLKKEGLK